MKKSISWFPILPRQSSLWFIFCLQDFSLNSFLQQSLHLQIKGHLAGLLKKIDGLWRSSGLYDSRWHWPMPYATGMAFTCWMKKMQICSYKWMPIHCQDLSERTLQLYLEWYVDLSPSNVSRVFCIFHCVFVWSLEWLFCDIVYC